RSRNEDSKSAASAIPPPRHVVRNPKYTKNFRFTKTPVTYVNTSMGGRGGTTLSGPDRGTYRRSTPSRSQAEYHCRRAQRTSMFTSAKVFMILYSHVHSLVTLHTQYRKFPFI